MIKHLTLLILLLSLSGCETEILTPIIDDFEHIESERFSNEEVINADYLNKFTDEDILFIVDINGIQKGPYLVWLGSYSYKESQSVEILSANISNGENEIVSNIKNKKLVLKNERETYQESLKLFQIPAPLLPELGNDGPLTLNIKYKINAGDERKMQFKIKHFQYRDIAWPT